MLAKLPKKCFQPSRSGDHAAKSVGLIPTAVSWCLCWGQLNGSFRFQVRTWLFCPRLAATRVLFPFAVLTVPIAHSVICVPDFHSSPLLFHRLTHRLNSKVQEKHFACKRNLHTRGFALNYCETSGYNTGHGSFSEPSCLVLQPEGHIFSTVWDKEKKPTWKRCKEKVRDGCRHGTSLNI